MKMFEQSLFDDQLVQTTIIKDELLLGSTSCNTNKI
jgi:hypothetical protein